MINRLLGGPKLDDAQKARVPPGQYVTPKWPVLHYGSVPHTDLATWGFNVWGDVESPFSFTWNEFKQMPRKSVHCDIHCVTRWSRLDMDFSGVPIQHILERAQLKPSAHFVLAHCEQGYTANLPLDVLNDEDVLLADEANGEPLEPEHGYPLRRRTCSASGSATATTTTPIRGRKSASPTGTDRRRDRR
jgi:DMSO/TMAO reductase YedYZ molybdopterin-dependent catalytic subunit